MKKWRINKKYIALSILMVVSFAFILRETTGNMNENYEIIRPSFEEGSKKVPLYVWTEDGEKRRIDLEIHEQAPNEIEMEATQKSLYEEIKTKVLGENMSFDFITKDLNFVNKSANGYRIKWEVSPYNLFDVEGHILKDNVRKSQEFTLSAYVSIYDEIKQFDFVGYISVEAAIEEVDLLEEIRRIEKESSAEGIFRLPNVVNGQNVTYEEKKESKLGFLILFWLAIWGCLFGIKAEEKKKRREKLTQELLNDYPSVISLLSILTTAGMTLAQAFERITQDYEKNNSVIRPGFEEIKKAYYKQKSGVEEQKTYLEIGQESNLHEYRKLGNLLEQNLRKGVKGLSQLLESELLHAFELKKQLIKRESEKATSKLLFPMMLLLAIVLMIILIPSMMTFM